MCWSRVCPLGALNPMAGVHRRRWDTEGTIRDDRGRDWHDAAASRGVQGMAGRHRELGRRHRTPPPSEAPGALAAPGFGASGLQKSKGRHVCCFMVICPDTHGCEHTARLTWRLTREGVLVPPPCLQYPPPHGPSPIPTRRMDGTAEAVCCVSGSAYQPWQD